MQGKKIFMKEMLSLGNASIISEQEMLIMPNSFNPALNFEHEKTCNRSSHISISTIQPRISVMCFDAHV